MAAGAWYADASRLQPQSFETGDQDGSSSTITDGSALPSPIRNS